MTGQTRSKIAAFGVFFIASSLSITPAFAQQSARFKAPSPGTVFTYKSNIRIILKKDKVIKIAGRMTITVLRDSTPYQGVPVYRLKTETRIIKKGKPDSVSVTISIRRLKDGNEIATLNGKGELKDVVIPHSGNYAWPMSVGKSWQSTVERRTAKSKKGVKVTMQHRVVAFEKVTVPAGTFKTIRLVAQGKFYRGIIWFVPSLGVQAKASSLILMFGKFETSAVLTEVKRP